MKTENLTPPCTEVEVSTRLHAIRRSNVSLKCSTCQRRFPSIIRLQRHLRLVHKRAEKLFWCSKCSLLFNDISGFVRHTRCSHQNEGSGQHETHEEQLAPASQTVVDNNESTEKQSNRLSRENVKASNEEVASPKFQVRHDVKEEAFHTVESTPNKGDVISKDGSRVPATSTVAYVFVPPSQENTTENLDNIGGAFSAAQVGFADGKDVQNEKLSNFQKRNEASEDFNQSLMAGSMLTGHPTMADVGTTLHLGPDSLLASAKDSLASRRFVTKQSNKLSSISKRKRERREPVHHHTPKRPFTEGFPSAKNVERATNDDLNISIPETIKTVNLMSNADFDAKAERAEILTYLRTVTAKLDAVIRHFNVPFSELGLDNGTPSCDPTEHQRRLTPEIDLNQSSVHCHKSVFQKTLSHLQSSSNSNAIERNNESLSSYQADVSTPVDNRINEAVCLQESINPTTRPGRVTSPLPDCRKIEQLNFNIADITLPEETVQDLHSISLNRGNFAKQLVFHLFSSEERKGKNCFGRKSGLHWGPKAPLDPIRLQYVRDKVFQYYPCEEDLHDTVWRRQCVIAIDTALRCENRNRKKIHLNL